MVRVWEHVEHLGDLVPVTLTSEQGRVACHRDRIARHEHDHRRLGGGDGTRTRLAESGARRIGDDDVDPHATIGPPAAGLALFDAGGTPGEVLLAVGDRGPGRLDGHDVHRVRGCGDREQADAGVGVEDPLRRVELGGDPADRVDEQFCSGRAALEERAGRHPEAVPGDDLLEGGVGPRGDRRCHAGDAALRAVEAGGDLTGLAVLSGAIGVGLGFGLQKVVSNLVSGVIILLDKSIKPGDVISIGDTFGWINALGARYVSITTRDGKEYLIPNEDLITGQVVNWSHSNEFVRLDIHFGTSYADDPHVVRKLAIDAAASVSRVLNDRPPVCHITGFGDSSVDYILRFWITDPSGGLTNIRGNVFLALWDTFHEHGISIPFPQREVRLLESDEAPSTPA